MEKKTKFEYEMDEFNSAFEGFENKRIVIYGTGRMTATLIEYNKKYNIVGLCDRDPSMIGTKVYGIPVLSKEEAENMADIVIINTASSYWSTIYKRISDWNIPVYFRNGELAQLGNTCNSDDPYWNCSILQLKSMISEADVVSFDVFDTLIMRKVMSPFDVFKIVEQRLLKEWGDKAREYIPARKTASSRMDNPTFDELFNEIGNITHWKDEDVEYVKNLEILAEKSLITSRKDIAELLCSACQDKEVYFISDMYFSSGIIKEILEQCNICTDNVKIIVSCDMNMDKASGSLWKWYADNIVKGRKALHIGDNYKSDYVIPKQYGIEAFYILNAGDMLEKSSISGITEKIISIHSSLAMGHICARIFNSPFALNESKGVVGFEDDFDAGYCLFGCFSYNFITWLVNRAKKDGVLKIAFLARDGYLVKDQYDYMSSLVDEQLPNSIYLECSRRVVWAAWASNVDNLYKVASFPYKGNAKDFLKDRFGIEKDSIELEKIDMTEVQNNKELLMELIDQYKDVILGQCEIERKNYLNYLRSVKIDANTAVVDSQLYGTIQYYLGHLLGFSLNGYYMCCKLDDTNEYLPFNKMYGCFQAENDLSANGCAVKEYGDFVESFYTAANGMTLYVDESGNPIYGQAMSNQKYFDVRLRMNEGVKKFILDIIEVCKRNHIPPFEVQDALFADDLLRCYAKDGFVPTDSMKAGFYYDNGVSNRLESPIWG